MRTTIDLPDAVFREVKTRAVSEGTTLKDLVARFIVAGLRGEEPSKHGHREERAPLPVAIKRDLKQALTRNLSNEELEALLESEDVRSVLDSTRP